MKKTIWHISDTHCLHDYLTIPKADIVIHSGDFANSRIRAINTNEVLNFINWFKSLDIKHKILVSGNHDVSIENRMIRPDFIKENGIAYLENEETVIDGIKIWGSPITPSFGKDWAWNVARHKTCKVWEQIPEDVDIIVTHGPPKGVLDLNREMSMCGCSYLTKVVSKIKPKLHLFGHVHDNESVLNSGIRKLPNLETIFSNGSVVCDGKSKLINNGNLITL